MEFCCARKKLALGVAQGLKNSMPISVKLVVCILKSSSKNHPFQGANGL